MDGRYVEEENMVELYEASRHGCLNTLNTLIQGDPRILDRVSLTSFPETPLHIASLLGHIEFSRLLVGKKPTLAKEVDALGRTPLHLASAEGHTEIVQALLKANTDVCLAFDQDERIPLHLAAMRGRIEIMKELIIARPESVRVNLNGGSILHLCVRFNHLDALKFLVESVADCDEFLNSEDHDGNSILHSAVMLKQTKAIKYLLSLPPIKRKVNATNMIGYTALDVLEVCPRDFKCVEIQIILKEAGVGRSRDLNSSVPPPPSGIGGDEAQPPRRRQQSGQPAALLRPRITSWGNLMEKTRGTWMVVAILIAAMAFQAALSPPGGVWQGNTKSDEAGIAVLSYSHPDDYLCFLFSNTASFSASVCVLFLLIIGFPLTSTFARWLLAVNMSAALLFLAITYLSAVSLVTADPVLVEFSKLLGDIIFYVLCAGSVIVCVILIRWVVIKRKLFNFIRNSTRGPAEDHPANVSNV